MGTRKTTFHSINAVQDWTIPLDCGDTIQLTLKGAGGRVSGGNGDLVIATLAIDPSWRGVRVLRFRVGGTGGAPVGGTGGLGGYGLGGDGGDSTGSGSNPGYGGGGATDIRWRDIDDSLAGRLLVAGGGGAGGRGGSAGTGGDGGATTGGAGGHGTGGSPTAGGGAGGSQVAGGAGGTAGQGTSLDGGDGSLGQGGHGSNHSGANISAGGGGGGGYYGGGGGAGIDDTVGDSGGGAGGSGYIKPGTFTNTTHTRGGGSAIGDDGVATVEYWPTPQPPQLAGVVSLDPEGIVTPQRVNLAPRPSFEADLGPWTAFGPATATQSTTKFHLGTHSMRVQWGAAAPKLQGTTVVIATTPGRKYTVTAWVLNTVAGTPQPFFYPGFANSEIIEQTVAQTHDNASWEVITLSFIASNIVEVLILSNALGYSGIVANCYTYVDQVMVGEGDDTSYFDGNFSGAFFTDGSSTATSYIPAVVDPDKRIKILWAYRADTTNTADHWKSFIDYNTDDGTVWHTTDFGGEADIKTIPNWHVLSYTIPAGAMQPGNTYYIRIRDMNNNTEAYGQPTVVQVNTPARPATPVWVDPVVNQVLDTLPHRILWTATNQVRWRVTQHAPADTALETPVWDSGWQRSSMRAGVIDPRVRGGFFLLALWVHNGSIASDPITVRVNIPYEVTRVEGLAQAAKIELEIYDGITGEFISNVPSRIAPTYLEELRGPGGGSFTLRLDDATWAEYPTLIKQRNVVRVKDDGRYIGFWVITGHTPTTVATEEGSAEAIIVKGVGGYGIWPSDALVYPEWGNDSFASTPSIVGKKRAFGVASSYRFGNWYNFVPWDVPAFERNQTDAGSTNPWKAAPSDWPADLAAAQWVWDIQTAGGLTPHYAVAGTVIFQRAIINSYGFPVPIECVIAADDEAQVYLDGDPWVYTNAWQSSTTSDTRWIDTGEHQVVIIAAQGFYQFDISSTEAPAGLLFGLYTLSPGLAADVKAVTLTSSATAFNMLAYPAVLAGWTAGDVIQQLVTEAQGRSVTSFGLFGLGFDDEFDSYARRWVKTGAQWFFNIFDSLAQVFDTLSDHDCEIWFDENLMLQAARTRGVDRAQLNPPQTYADLITAAEPAFYFKFLNAFVSATMPLVGNVEYFADETGGALLLDISNLKFSTTHDFKSFFYDGSAANLEPPASNRHGLINVGSTGTPNPAVFSIDMATGGKTALDVSGGDGFTIEFLLSDAYIYLGIEVWSGADNTSLANPNAGDGAHFIFWNNSDWSASRTLTLPFYATEILEVFSDTNGGKDNAKVFYPLDHETHHIAIVVRTDGEDTATITYRDGVEVAFAETPMPFNAEQVALNWLYFVSPDNPKTTPGIGHLAIYNRTLTEDEIFDHAQKFVDDAFDPPLEPVIFSKGKNILSAGAEVDFAAKTMLVSRSSGPIAEVKAPKAVLDQYGRIEGYYDGSSSPIIPVRRTAFATIISSLQAQSSSTIDLYGPYRPWRDFGVGDWVLAPDDYGQELVRRRVVSLSIAEDPDTGRSVYTQEIDSLNQEEARRLNLWMSRTLPQGNLSGLIADQS